MSTQGLLANVVFESSTDVKENLGLVEEFVTAARRTPVSKRTTDEANLLKVFAAANKKTNFLPLVNVAKAIEVGGVDKEGMPNLAVASYDMSFGRQAVTARVADSGSVRFENSVHVWNVETWGMDFPAGTLPKTRWPRSWDYPISRSAAVPIVPSVLRQTKTQNLIVLFEVAKWEAEVRIDVDPYLLKLVAGSVYAVLGTWDVTKLELKAFQVARHFGV